MSSVLNALGVLSLNALAESPFPAPRYRTETPQGATKGWLTQTSGTDMTTFRALAIALPLLIATTASVWTAMPQPSECGPSPRVIDPQLRAILARADRDRTIEVREMCARSRGQTSAPQTK